MGVLPLLLVSVLLIDAAMAWGDEGHMLIGAIARHILLKSHGGSSLVKALEKVLYVWEEQYPGLSRLTTAPVWADHIKCEQGRPWCRGLLRYDAIEVFNEWHYSDKPYNPQDLPIPHFRRGTHDALWLLERANHTMINFGKKQNEGTALSWNLFLRLLLHVYGDIHQPLHSCTMFAKPYPHGDAGGNEIPVILNHTAGHEHVGELHLFWDLGGGALEGNWPTLGPSDMEDEAVRLLAMFPELWKSKHADKVGFREVLDESYKICAKFVYSEFDFSTLEKRQPYYPSDAYVAQAQHTSLERMVLGGARLAKILIPLARNAPPPQQIIGTREGLGLFGWSLEIWQALCGVLLLLSLCSSCGFMWVGWRNAYLRKMVQEGDMPRMALVRHHMHDNGIIAGD